MPNIDPGTYTPLPQYVPPGTGPSGGGAFGGLDPAEIAAIRKFRGMGAAPISLPQFPAFQFSTGLDRTDYMGSDMPGYGLSKQGLLSQLRATLAEIQAQRTGIPAQVKVGTARLGTDERQALGNIDESFLARGGFFSGPRQTDRTDTQTLFDRQRQDLATAAAQQLAALAAQEQQAQAGYQSALGGALGANAQYQAANPPPGLSAWMDTFSNGQIPFSEMVNIPGIGYVAPFMVAELQQMIGDAKRAGIDLTATGAYRSYDQQVALYQKKPDLAAKPGHSMHGYGLAIDFTNTPKITAWLKANAGKYGFNSFDFGKEPWHWSYGVVG